MLDAAEQIDDLRIPPGNKLLKGMHSIRWTMLGVEDVEIIDYP